mmetsp:Transcript_160274/g.307542  ORF Transcript_160274/g.307542 Transcript_160274/m.307542 type:complete len:648 (-) Transcript_160274:112-2055(-)
MRHVNAVLGRIREMDLTASSIPMSMDSQGFHASNCQPAETADESFVVNVQADQTQSESGLMKVWCALMQDQVGTVIRDMDSLRASNSQLLTRLDAQANLANDNMMSMHRLEQEVKNIKLAEQAEREERSAAFNKAWDAISAETQKRAEIRDEQQRAFLQLRSVLDEEIRTRQDAHERQDEKVHKFLANFRSEFRAELEQQSNLIKQALDLQTALKQVVEREARERSVLEENVAGMTTKWTAAVEKAMKSCSSGQDMLQSQIELITKDISAERRDWGLRRAELQSKILHSLAEQEVMLVQERQARHEQYEKLSTVERQARAAQHESLLEKLSSERSANSKLIAENRDELQQLLTDTVASHAAEFRQFVSESCMRERETSKEAYEALRLRLQEVLQETMVSKTEFSGEAQRLWQAVQQSPIKTSPLRASSPGERTATLETRRTSSLPGSVTATPAKVWTSGTFVTANAPSARTISPPRRMSSAPSAGVLFQDYHKGQENVCLDGGEALAFNRQPPVASAAVNPKVIVGAIPMEELLASGRSQGTLASGLSGRSQTSLAGRIQSPESPRKVATVSTAATTVQTPQRSASPLKHPAAPIPQVAQAGASGTVFARERNGDLFVTVSSPQNRRRSLHTTGGAKWPGRSLHTTG